MTFHELEPHQDIPFSQLCWASGKMGDELREWFLLTIPYCTQSHCYVHPTIAACLDFHFLPGIQGEKSGSRRKLEQNGVENYYLDDWSSTSW